MKTRILFSLALLFAVNSSFAKIWRVNNTIGVVADFADLPACLNNASVLSGDTVHVEPSASAYSGGTLTKSLTFIGNGFHLAAPNGNTGLQENTNVSNISNYIILANGSAGSKFIGLYFVYHPYVQSGYSGNLNVLFEKCYFSTYMMATYENTTYSNLSYRKCYFDGGAVFYMTGGTPVVNNLTVENCIVANYMQFNPDITSTNNTIRNNTVGTYMSLTRCYVANNIIGYPYANSNTYNNCVVSNNVFVMPSQTGVTSGPLNVNGNNLFGQPWADIVMTTGSTDAAYQLKPTSPAISGGVLIGAYKPDCGAFGGPDPYKLSGIPGIPTIYGLVVPSSIPVGTPSMNSTISTRNNN